MSRYVAVRLYSMGLTLLGLTVLVFLMLRLVPGTVVEQMIGADAVVSQAMVDELKRFFGLDQPWYVQYFAWVGRLAHGDLGTSWRTGKPVILLILERLPVTLELTILSVGFALALGMPAGICRRYGGTARSTRSRAWGRCWGYRSPSSGREPCSFFSSRSISAGCRRSCGWISSPIPGGT
jgi:ABC-type dipeptide/oligopeptide/nickel transport system permease component